MGVLLGWGSQLGLWVRDTMAQRFWYSQRAKAQELCEMKTFKSQVNQESLSTATAGLPSESHSAKGFCPVTRWRVGTG